MYGNLPDRKLPRQDQELILLLANRWSRAADAHERWAKVARMCVDFVEGRQWTEAQLKEMARQKRPVLTLNKIGRLLRLVMGYFENNQTTINYLPGHDGSGSTDMAEVLNRVSKQIDEMNETQFLHTEWSMDGLITGRGFVDSRLSFEENDFGEVKHRAKDPFNIYLDPLGTDYDLNESSGIIEKRTISLDECEWLYGKEAKNTLAGFVGGGGWDGISSLFDLYAGNEDVAPRTGFGSYDAGENWINEIQGLYGELIDPFRKDITVLDFQYWVRRHVRMFIDLETGDRKAVPDNWDDDKIAKVMDHADRLGNPLRVVWRPEKRVRWTTLAGPIAVYDKEVPYDTFSITPYFPYFRKGQTRGMVEDLLDPQREVNKSRSANIEILSKTANGGWLRHEQGLTEEGKRNLRNFGSTPGVDIEWTGEAHMKPEQLTPTVSTQRVQQREQAANSDFGEISGINESALGDIDKVQSGRAIEARQRQAVIAVQPYITMRNRTMQLFGKKRLNIIQNHYTEKRILRIIGEDGQPVETIINDMQQDPMTGAVQRINDVTVGKYTVAIDETPISSTFLAAQFDEALMLLEKMGPVGAMLAQTRPDLIVDMSSLPRKEEWVEALRQAIGMMPGTPAEAAGVAPGQPAATAPSLDQGIAGPGAEVIQIPT